MIIIETGRAAFDDNKVSFGGRITRKQKTEKAFLPRVHGAHVSADRKLAPRTRPSASSDASLMLTWFRSSLPNQTLPLVTLLRTHSLVLVHILRRPCSPGPRLLIPAPKVCFLLHSCTSVFFYSRISKGDGCQNWHHVGQERGFLNKFLLHASEAGTHERGSPIFETKFPRTFRVGSLESDPYFLFRLLGLYFYFGFPFLRDSLDWYNLGFLCGCGLIAFYFVVSCDSFSFLVLMEEDDEYETLRLFLKERCPGAKFRDADIKILVDEGYDSESALKVAVARDSLTMILPGRRGVVDVLTTTFVATSQSAVEETSAKRRKVVSSFQIGDQMKMNFQSKDCDIREWEIGALVRTAGMNKVMESFGGFPAKYYVRQEEIKVFETIWSRWKENCSKAGAMLTQFTLLGSPGVGKSAFIVFLAFYMARLNLRSVLLLRRVKGPHSEGYKCVVLSHDYYSEIKFINFPNINYDISLLREKFPGLLYFVDGFSQAEVNQNYGLAGYHMLATSSQFRWKGDDPTEVVVLPAWQFCDLKEYDLKTKMFEPDVDAEERSRTRYYYSGGSLREFCRDLPELEERVKESLRGVGGTDQAVMLMGEHGGGSATQVDGLFG